jgi:hypothetical protein
MGKSSGGLRGGGGNAATEQGYTAKMKRNILGVERVHRTDKDESMHIFSPDGTHIKTIQGKGNRVQFFRSDVPADSIITHNHPLSLGKTGTAAIGHSFSGADIFSAIGTNAREMRAVTPTYTFSIKRPAKGWGKTEEQVRRAYKKIDNEVRKEMLSYINSGHWSDYNVTRADITHAHEVMKRISKKFGWQYTKKRG